MEIYGKDFNDCLLVSGNHVINGNWDGKFTPDSKFYYNDPKRAIPLLMKVPPLLAKGDYNDIISACEKLAKKKAK